MTEKFVGIAGIVLAFMGWPVAAAEKPNIVFIMADDLGVFDLGCYGQKLIQTPNIDQLAREGTRFTQVYGGASVCAPSRSVLMTGLHTGHTRIRGNHSKVAGVIGEEGERGRVPLRPEDLTIAEVLKGAGYTTGMTGKWGLGEPNSTGEPNLQGFDEWFGYLNQDRATNYYPDSVWKNRERHVIAENADGKQGAYSHDLFTDFALDFIRRHQSEPFFLYVPYTIPHVAHQVPDLQQYAGRDWPDKAREYAAMISRMDADVGRIVKLLDHSGLSEKTLVFFCSDHGGPAAYQKVFASNGNLRGRKGTLSEGGLRTPMIVRWTGQIPASRTSDVVWSFPDLFPTFAELAGARVTTPVDGVSILPTLLGKSQNLEDRMLYWEQMSNGLQQAVRWQNWKAVRTGLAAPLEIYDLASDPTESHNVANEHPEVVRRVEEFLKTARSESEEWPLLTRNPKQSRAK
ncbi:arylsulfatase [Planctomicrobium sp. SH664]|uniref:arylsulfatase n=1 Tax=Planctomicrobium sp. SH664 TaxID=3448125 RepID=UPI003F5AF5D6